MALNRGVRTVITYSRDASLALFIDHLMQVCFVIFPEGQKKPDKTAASLLTVCGKRTPNSASSRSVFMERELRVDGGRWVGGCQKIVSGEMEGTHAF